MNNVIYGGSNKKKDEYQGIVAVKSEINSCVGCYYYNDSLSCLDSKNGIDCYDGYIFKHYLGIEPTIKELQDKAFEIARSKGQYPDEGVEVNKETVLSWVDKLGTEVEELKKALKKGNYDQNSKDSVPSEFADLVLFTASFTKFLDIDLNRAINWKMKFNRKRTDNNGEFK